MTSIHVTNIVGYPRGSREPGAGSREPGAGSREPGGRRRRLDTLASEFCPYRRPGRAMCERLEA
ncbi:hypothetical protein FVP33_09900 [Lacisediminihabitans profunda]|uniref:Uncharacterized protein n=1 Tax=Lacisediminihabitans profunda TaxID=2594790 RepID=A0A5C8UQV9_9MICO|nr:hypothetical protein FVP33_09900 [Lacisediminihabitans profunda]